MGFDLSQLVQCDNHVHTSMCGHAIGTMEEYVLAAIEKGLSKLVFLEHMEEGIVIPKSSWLSEKDFDDYFKEGRRLQEKYNRKISIGLGVECGYNPLYSTELQDRLAKREWDQIGISCHFLKIDGEPNHLNLLSKKPESVARATEFYSSSLFNSYLDILTNAVIELSGTMLCHLDAAFRWVARHKITDEQYEKIDRLLEIAATKSMALEVNTSGISIRKEPFPNSHILHLASRHKMALKLGSDAHRPEDVGRHFDDVTTFIDTRYPRA